MDSSVAGRFDFSRRPAYLEEAMITQRPCYHSESVEAKERILYANYLRFTAETKDMTKSIQDFNKQ